MLPAEFTPTLLRQLELLKLRSRRAFLGARQGGHVSPKKGHGIEFSDYRQYELGDNPRHIDWGVYARTDRLYVKRYQEEQDLRVLIVLDGSASMGECAGISKWKMACNIALAVAYVALLDQDSVSISVPGGLQSPLYYGGRAIHSAAQALADISPTIGQEISFDTEVRRAALRVRFPGIALVISDFLMPLDVVDRAFTALRARNLDISAIQVLGDEDIDPLSSLNEARVRDSETNQETTLQLTADQRSKYGELLVQHNFNLAQYFSDSGTKFMRVVGSESIERVVIDGIPKMGILR